MLYTIVPMEKIFEGTLDDKMYLLEEKVYNGQLVEVKKLENNSFELSRVISTNPQIYLNIDFNPGKVIKTN